jgi:MoaA/NifB/PqqE/SkfB family radical SAM enzyme
MNNFAKPKWFPIPGDKSCLYKWTQVSVYLWSGTSSACHRNKSFRIGDDFDFHNTPEILADRTKMLAGEWPGFGHGCEHCRDQEHRGGISDRMQLLSNPDSERYVSQEMYDDPTNIKVTPTQLSVDFNNKCNLKCVYCGPNLSSSWVKEIEKFGDVPHTIEEPWLLDKTYHERQKKLLDWMEKNYHKLKAFDILGGEPMIQPETFQYVDWMIKHPNKEIDFELYSNMQLKPRLFKKRVQKFRELADSVREVLWTASIDCWGPASEYIRFGHDLETWEENWTYLLEECPEIKTSMNWTVTPLSISHIPELMEKVIKWNKIRYSAINFNKVIDPDYMDPNIFPQDTFKNDIKIILELNELMCKRKEYKDYIKSMFKEIDSAPTNYNKIKELKQNLDILDFRRGTNWKDTFPWLRAI